MGFGQTEDKGIQCPEALDTPMGSSQLWYLGLPLKLSRMPIAEWQPIVEKGERHFEGWQTKVMLRGAAGSVMISPIGKPLFHPSVFNVPIGTGKRLERV